jgi:two-component system, NtrC family, sensor kinase
MTESIYRVLAVDDEQMSLRLIKRVFMEDPDIEVVTTTSPFEALRLSQSFQPHVIISDQLMPEMTGVELLARLAESQPASIRIMLTAFPQLSAVLRAVNDGQIYKFLTKPCDHDELRLIVRSALKTLITQGERDQMVGYLSQQVVRLEKLAALGRNVAGVVHDLSNPISIAIHEQRQISRFLKNLPPDAKSGATTIGDAQISCKNVEAALGAMLTSVQNMLAHLHPGRGREEHFDLNAGLEQMFRLMAYRLVPEVEVVREYGQIPSIVCNIPEITQVLSCLISNAADAVQGHGVIRAKTSGDLTSVRVEIMDSGPGMDPETLGNLFRPFFTTKPPDKGIGLGLALAKHIVERHRGTIQVESTLGQGSRFSVILPVSGPAGESATP